MPETIADGVTVTLDPLEFEAFVRRVEGVDLARARANQLISDAQAKANAAYDALVKKYGDLPKVATSIQWNDETHEISVK